jgi:membrane protein implicated in regulation of membrane protease activity
MDPADPDAWRWIWLIGSVTFAVGEIFTAGSFFLAPFAIGAAVAALLAFGGAGISIGWAAFLGVSVATFVALRPLARRMDQGGPVLGLGAHRQIGASARVVQAIGGPDEAGQVLLGAEQWRAESVDGELIPIGAAVSVVEVRGTRLVVRTDPTRPPNPPLPDDSSTTG